MNLRCVVVGLFPLVLAACGGSTPQVDVAGLAAARTPLAQQAADPTTGALRVFQAFYGRAPTATEFNALSSPDSAVLASGFATSMTSMGDAALATAVLSNMGVTTQVVNASSYSILQAALAQYFAAYGTSARGTIVNNLTGLLAGMDSDATWGAAARSFNAAVNSARAVVTASTTPSSGCIPTVSQGFQGDIEVVAASAGGGGDGSGSGGGAAAGGGLGKVLGGAMTVMDLSTGNIVGQGITDSATGLVTIRTCTLRGPFLLTLDGRSGTRYFDEGLNTLVDFPAGSVLHALVDQWDEHVGVSPITEAAYRYALNNFKADASRIAAGSAPLMATGSLVGITAAQVRQANAVASAEVNARLPTNYQIASAKALPTPIDAGSGTNALPDTRYGRSAAVNGGLVKSAQLYNVSQQQPALALADQLARDLTDGRIDGFALDGSQVAAADRTTYESVRLPLASTIATNVVTDRFAAQSLKTSVQRIEEESFVRALTRGDQDALDCRSFYDEVALLSDRSVTVVRYFPTVVNGICRFLGNDDEFNRRVTIRNFLTDVKLLSREGSAGFAVKTDGSVYGWGLNYCGSIRLDLPNGYITSPVPIPGVANVTSISTDGVATVARDSTGVISYWGWTLTSDYSADPPSVACDTWEINGQRGINYMYTSIQKVQLANVTDVFARGGAYFALTGDGSLYGWGSGGGGTLANSDGSLNPVTGYLAGSLVTIPTRIEGLPKVRQIAFRGNWTIFALAVDGRVFAWGEDDRATLGNGTQRRTLRPTPVPGLVDGTILAGSFDGIRLVKRDGTVVAWGGGTEGARLIGNPYVPTVVVPPERIRHVVGRQALFTVYFASGRIARDVNRTDNVTLYFP